MFSNFLLYGGWLVAMTRILPFASEMEHYIAIQLLTSSFHTNLECDTTRSYRPAQLAAVQDYKGRNNAVLFVAGRVFSLL